MTGLAGIFDGTAPFSSGVAGYITNLDEVRRLTGAAGDASEADVAQALVARDGPDAIGRLRGAFAAAVWDESTRRGVLATDHLGAGGLFFTLEPRRVAFAAEIRDLLDLLRETPVPDEDALIRWLAFDASAPGQTLYAGIRRLRPGELIELGPATCQLRRYWQPRYVESPRRADYTTFVREAATAAVARRLDPTRETGVLLSGGLDSTSVAGLAGGSGLHAFSAAFPEHPEMDESALVDEVAETLRLPLTRLEVRGGSMLAGSLEYLASWRVPCISPNLLFLAPLARAAADEGVAVLLDGEGGDELFGGSTYLFADLVLRGRLSTALRLAERLPGVRVHSRRKVLRWVLREWALKGAAPHAAHSLLRRARPAHYGARWLTPSAARRHGRSADPWAWKRLDGPRSWASLAYDFTEGRAQLGAHDFLRHKSVLAGVSGRHPYLEDLDLTEQMLSIPSEESFDDTFDRPLLRQAVAGLVPDAVRLRPEKSYFNALFEEVLTSTDRTALLDLFADGARIAPYVRLEELRSWLTDPAARPSTWRWVVWRAATAECWLRTLEDDSFPEHATATWQALPPRLELRRGRGVAPTV